MKTLTVGKLAQRAGIGIETVRFYERKGLIKEPPRNESGYRQYPEDVVSRILFIRRAKELGFTLKEIDELLSLKVDPESTCADVRERAEAKIADIDQRLGILRRMKNALQTLVIKCNSESQTDDCPILEALEEGENYGG